MYDETTKEAEKAWDLVREEDRRRQEEEEERRRQEEYERRWQEAAYEEQGPLIPEDDPGWI